MKRYIGIVMVVVTVLVGGCGSGGYSADPPTDVAVVAKDSRIVVSWTMVPGVEYWLFKAAGDGVTPFNCISMPSCTTIMKAASPTTLTGLPNGTTFSVSINGRINGGAGGPGSTALSATPRMAGTTWTAGTVPTGSGDLRGVAYGAMFVAAGTAGSLYSSTDGTSWTALTNPLPTANFNAVNYDANRGRYLSAGAGGAVIAMTPAVSGTWTQQTSNTASDLYAIANNAAGLTVAAGAGGTVIRSSDGTSWTVGSSGTANALYGLAYGYDNTNNRSQFVAVGAAGTLLYSADGTTWTAASCPTCTTTPDLRGVVYGAAAGVFVAVGTGGTVLTSTDGITWTPRTSGASVALNAVTFTPTRRFVAVGDGGVVYYSEYASLGTIWTQAVQPTPTTLYAVTTDNTYDYSAVGAAGFNLYSD